MSQGNTDHTRTHCRDGTAHPPLYQPHAGAARRHGRFRPAAAGGRPEARMPAAFRLVQGARRLHQSARAAGPRGRRRRGIGRQSWRRRRLCRHAARPQGDDLRSRSEPAGQAGPHPRLWRRAGRRRRPLCRGAGRQRSVSPRKPAPCRSMPSTRRKRWSARARSASRSRTTCRRSTRCWSPSAVAA